MSLIRNEQTKLTATYLNGVAIAVIAVGGLAPLFSNAFDLTASQPLQVLALAAAICFLVSAVLHLVARRILRGLVP